MKYPLRRVKSEVGPKYFDVEKSRREMGGHREIMAERKEMCGQVCSAPACYGSSVVSNPDISQ
jgi:hypothetical protein